MRPLKSLLSSIFILSAKDYLQKAFRPLGFICTNIFTLFGEDSTLPRLDVP